MNLYNIVKIKDGNMLIAIIKLPLSRKSENNDGDFKEEDHPREENGRFVKKGSGKSSGGDIPKLKKSSKFKKGQTTSRNSKFFSKSLENSLTSNLKSDKIKNTETPTAYTKSGKKLSSGATLSKSECDKIDDAFRRKLETGEQSKKIISKKQAVHIKGSKEYERLLAAGVYKSYFTIDENELQLLVDEFAGKGQIRHRGNYPDQFIEDVDCGKEVGISVSPTGKETKTSAVTSHYSGKGAHIVPKFTGGKNGFKK